MQDSASLFEFGIPQVIKAVVPREGALDVVCHNKVPWWWVHLDFIFDIRDGLVGSFHQGIYEFLVTWVLEPICIYLH